MTSDPIQIFIMLLVLVAFPLIAWVSGRIGELIVNGEEERIPKNLKWLAKREYIESVRKGKSQDNRWRFFVVVIGLVIPLIMLCSASPENLVPRLLVILTSTIIFFMGVALLEWLVRPRSSQDS